MTIRSYVFLEFEKIFEINKCFFIKQIEKEKMKFSFCDDSSVTVVSFDEFDFYNIEQSRE
jgi:hypothetical protein